MKIENLKNARSIDDFLRALKLLKEKAKENAKLISNLNESVSCSLSGIKTRSKIKISTSVDDDVFETRRNETPLPFNQGKKVKVPDSFKRPDIKELVQIFEPIKQAYGVLKNLREMEVIYENKLSEFPNNETVRKKAKLFSNEVAEMKKLISDSFQEAYNSLNAIARENHPKKLDDIVDHIKELVEELVDKNNYSNIEEKFFVAPVQKTGEKNIHYTYYIGLLDLKDLVEYKYDSFYFVITGILDSTDGTISYYLAFLYEFQPPGSFPVGKPLTSFSKESLKRTVENYLTSVNIKSKFEKYPFDISKEKAEVIGLFDIPGVKNVLSKNNIISLILEENLGSTETQRLNKLSKIIYDARILLKRYLNSTNEKYAKSLTHSISKTKKGKDVVRFMLISSPKSKQPVSQEMLDQIAEIYDLDREEQNELKRCLIQRLY